MVTRHYQIKKEPGEDLNNNVKERSNALPNKVSRLQGAKNLHFLSYLSGMSRRTSARSNSSIPGAVPSNAFKKSPQNAHLAAFLICTNCCAPRSKYGKSKFCSECGTMYPGMKGGKPAGPKRIDMGTGTVDNRYSQAVQASTMTDVVNEQSKLPVELNSVMTSPVKKTCSKCRSSNPADAQFCGSCGKKQETWAETACPQCQNQVPVGSRFCLSCGALYTSCAETDEIEESMNMPANDLQPLTQFSAKPDATTKPHGYFVSRKKSSEAVPLETQTSTRQPVINPIASKKSPGGGFWRKQLDHIASNLKLYAQSSKEFQQEVAEFQIGKITGATVDAAERDGVFRLCIDFELYKLEGQENYSGIKKRATSRFRESAKAKSDAIRKSRLDEFQDKKKRSSSAVGASRKNQNATSSSKRRTRSTSESRSTLTLQSQDLLKEVQLDKDVDEIIRLLNSGSADANVKDREGTPVLVLAVREFFHEAIQPLIQAGANPDVHFGPKNNTPLHEAVMLGPAGKQTVQALLRSGANAQIENKIGESAQALAIKHGYSELADILASHISQKLLKQ